MISILHYMYSMLFFMLTNVFVHLTHLKLHQIRSQAYLKIFVWSEHLIKMNLKYYEKHFLGIFKNFTRSGIFHNLSINALSYITH